MANPLDDLPSDLLEELRLLEQELEEGDITQKGYEKKKAALLALAPAPASPAAPQDAPPASPAAGSPIVTRTFRPTEGEYYHQPRQFWNSQNQEADEQDEQEEPVVDDAAVVPEGEYVVDLGPEPSAADTMDFLDFLPSPTHSSPRVASPEPFVPKEVNKPAPPPAVPPQQLQQQLQYQQQLQQTQAQPMSYTQQAPPPAPPMHGRPPPGAMYRPIPPSQPQQPQQQAWPGHAPPMRPVQRPYNGPPMMRPAYPPQQQHVYNQRPVMHPMYRPRPPPPQQGYQQPPQRPFYRPVPPQPQQQQPSLPPQPQQQHTPTSMHQRTPSMDSSHVSVERSHTSTTRHSAEPSELDPSSPSGMRQKDDNWETASMRLAASGRAASIMSTATTRRPAVASRNMEYRNRGRSRYGDSYMATSFKAIEPAPVSLVRWDDPYEQMLIGDLAGRQMRPLQPRSVPALAHQENMEQFESLGAILRYRGTNDALKLTTAFTVVDAKGKEPASITWDKLHARAEKIAALLREKSGLQHGSRVALFYRKSEVLEFMIALFGCMIAGMVAVPVNSADDVAELAFILNVTNATLVMTTDYNHSSLFKDLQARSMDLPTGVDWWRTNSYGTWYPSKKTREYPPMRLPELAYIEYAKAINGELKGVAITHRTLMSEGKLYKTSTTSTHVAINDTDNALQVSAQHGAYFDTVVTYLEPRQQVGLILSVLCSVYCGNHTVFTSGSIVDTPAAWIYVISKFKATIALADYPAMHKITRFYQEQTKQVLQYSKKVLPDLSSLRYLFIDSCVVKPDVNILIADKLLRPLGNTDDPMAVVCPVASLSEHGGMLLSLRDNLGPAQLEGYDDQGKRSVFAEGASNDVWECALDAEALKSNKVVVTAAGNGVHRTHATSQDLVVGAFGFPIAEGTVAIVDPDTTMLCPPDTIGEVWIDAPSISGGFWALPRHSEAVFHPKPIVVSPDTLYPELYNQEFLRTGLVGTLIGGRLVLFGNYEERIRQQRFGEPVGQEDIYFANDILNVIETRIGNDQATVFDITVNDQHLPVVMCESSAARNELIKLSAEIEECVLELLGLRLFAIAIVAQNALPRQLKHGRNQIHMLMAKRSFLMGQLTLRYVRMDVDRTVFNLAGNDNPDVTLWRSGLAYERALRQRAIHPHPQQQHTGMETIHSVIDERTNFDLAKFSNVIDILQWRTAIHPEEIAYVALSHNSSGVIETKPYTWRKINYSIAYVANYLLKRGFKRGRKALVVVSFGVDWILAIHACLAIGVIPVPMPMPDSEQQQPQRIRDEVEAIYATARDLNCSHMIVNSVSEATFKHKYVGQAMRQLAIANYKGFKLPEFTNINRASKHHKLLGKESGIVLSPDWVMADHPHIVLSVLAADGKRVYTALRHDAIIQQCRVQKTTSQMKWQRGIVATGLGASESIGLLFSTFCGIYVGCITVLVPTDDYYLNPFCFFDMVQRYKAKDVCVTLPMMQYAMNRMNSGPEQQRRLALHNVQNVMLVTEGRPRPLFYQHLARFFAMHRLEKEALNTAYSHIANPMISTRSYMLSEPIMLIADLYWLRRGIIRALPLEDEAHGVVLNDSGIVPSNTMIAIVNPETHALCPSNMVGEIWVSSDCNVRGLITSNGATDAQMLEATLPGNDPRIKYLRTGDLGFLWNVHRRGNRMDPMMEEGQCLYVLGPKSDVLERNGLMHFPMDVEATIERCHAAIPANGSIVIQVNGEIIAIVAVKGKEQAIAITPLVVSAVLENHSFLIDTVAIVLQNNLPRSRFGEKQRDKALHAYLEKKLQSVYVKRITNQHEPLHLNWDQSQHSNDNNDTMSMRTTTTRPMSTRASSIADVNDFDLKHMSSNSEDGLTRNDSVGTKRSATMPPSIHLP